MPKVRDSRDVAVGDVEMNEWPWHPRVGTSLQQDYRRFSIHLTDGQSPRNGHPFVVAEVRRVRQGTRETVRHTKARICGDQFPQTVPILVIESIHVQMQQPLDVTVSCARSR